MSEGREAIVLPWLKEGRRQQHGDSFSTRYVNSADEVTLIEEHKFFRCVSDGKEVETWLDSTQVRVNYRQEKPEVSVNWFGDKVGRRCKSLGFEEGAVYPDQLEGEEKVYIDKFVELVSDGTINPLGFVLGDGVYKCPVFSGLRFDVSFGLSGKPSCLRAIWPEGCETENVSMPWEMGIGVFEPIHVRHSKNRDGDVIQPGGYSADVRGWQRDPFMVLDLRLEGAQTFHIDENAFLGNVVTGKIVIFSIFTDKRRRY